MYNLYITQIVLSGIPCLIVLGIAFFIFLTIILVIFENSDKNKILNKLCICPVFLCLLCFGGFCLDDLVDDIDSDEKNENEDLNCSECKCSCDCCDDCFYCCYDLLNYLKCCDDIYCQCCSCCVCYDCCECCFCFECCSYYCE